MDFPQKTMILLNLVTMKQSQVDQLAFFKYLVIQINKKK